jgi:hypothetical protein
MNVRLYRYPDVVRALRSAAFPAIPIETPAVGLATRIIAAWLPMSAVAFTLAHDPDETIWLIHGPTRKGEPIETILSHESLHITLDRLGEWDGSRALDRYVALHRRKIGPLSNGGI